MNAIANTQHKTATTLILGALMALGLLIGVPTQAQAATVTMWDCRTYTTKVDHDTVRKDKWCTKNVGSLFPVYARVKVSTVYVNGVHTV